MYLKNYSNSTNIVKPLLIIESVEYDLIYKLELALKMIDCRKIT